MSLYCGCLLVVCLFFFVYLMLLCVLFIVGFVVRVVFVVDVLALLFL